MSLGQRVMLLWLRSSGKVKLRGVTWGKNSSYLPRDDGAINQVRQMSWV